MRFWTLMLFKPSVNLSGSIPIGKAPIATHLPSNLTLLGVVTNPLKGGHHYISNNHWKVTQPQTLTEDGRRCSENDAHSHKCGIQPDHNSVHHVVAGSVRARSCKSHYWGKGYAGRNQFGYFSCPTHGILPGAFEAEASDDSHGPRSDHRLSLHWQWFGQTGDWPLDRHPMHPHQRQFHRDGNATMATGWNLH